MIPEILMMPPSLSYCSLEGEDRGRDGKWCGDGFLGYGYDKVRMSHVWEGRAELVVWMVKYSLQG